MTDYVNASKPRVFLSYSRRDTAFVDELVVSVESYGFEVVFDRADLFPGEPWEPRLHRLITDAETTVCVVSSHWIASEQCRKELSIAVRQGRRIVPIIIDPVNPAEMPEDLARLQFVFFHGDGHSYARGVVSLVQTLRTDIGWMREQSRLLDKADEWATQSRSPTLLLRGIALENALAWEGSPAPRDTRVLPLVTEYIQASRAGQDNDEKQKLRDRLRLMIVGLAACVFGLIGTGAIGYIVYGQLQDAEVEKLTLEVENGEKSQVIENLESSQIAPPLTTTAPERVAEGTPLADPPDENEPASSGGAAPSATSTADLRRLVADLNSANKPTRLSAGQGVATRLRSPGSEPLLQLLASELELARFETLSPSGRVNVLYMLNGFGGWSVSPLGAQVVTSLDAIEARAGQTGTSLVLGGQASGCIRTLRQQIAGQSASGCGA